MNNIVKVIIMLFALIIYLILGSIYLLLSPIVVCQLFINKYLILIINIAPLSLKLLAPLLYNSNYNLSKEIINLLTKINKVIALP